MLSDNISFIKKEIKKACLDICRDPNEITLMGASKSQTIETIEKAFESGISHFGENYLQEAEAKIEATSKNIVWHFVGSIQTRKTKKIAQLFDWVHTVESEKIAERLNEARPKSKGKLNVCLQVNIDNEATKSGIHLDEIEDLLMDLNRLENIQARGLMIIPKPRESPGEIERVFSNLRSKMDSLKSKFPELDTLSMGMTSDYLVAVREGATMLRIGTGFFGARK